LIDPARCVDLDGAAFGSAEEAARALSEKLPGL
jgi:hypothetical protein